MAPALALVIFAASAPGPATPSLSADAAKSAYLEGVRQYREGAYAAAVESFQTADRLRSSPSLSFDIAQCYERMAALEKARRYYEEYLRRAPDADDRQAVEATIASIDARLAQPANPPAPAPILVEANTTKPPEASVRAVASAHASLAAWLLLGAGAVGLLTGGGLNLGAAMAANYPTTVVQPGAAVESNYGLATHLFTGAIVSYALGAALGIAGAVVYTLDTRTGAR